MKKAKISVIGGGSWATAITKILTFNKHDVKWWVRQGETVDHILKYNHNPKYLSSVEFHFDKEHVSTDIKKIISGSDYLVFATPSAYLKDTIQGLSPADFEGKVVISAIKGLIQPENVPVSLLMNQLFDVSYNKMANISGPCHAEEVASEKLSYLTFSSPDPGLAKEIASLFKCRFLHTRSCEDLVGTEYASVLKNVYALTAGITVGVGYGDNFRAVLVSHAMQEMQQFLDAVNPAPRNILEPAYLGDALVTAYSPYSRNRAFGLMIGKGYSINAAILELNMVAEGYYATKSLKTVADAHGLQLPILDAAYHILYGKISPVIEMRVLSDKFG